MKRSKHHPQHLFLQSVLQVTKHFYVIISFDFNFWGPCHLQHCRFDGLKNAWSIDKIYLVSAVCFKESKSFKSSCCGENLILLISTFMLEDHISFSKCFQNLRRGVIYYLMISFHSHMLCGSGEIHCRIRTS